jgi:modulator of FtsH protease HflC
MSRGVRIWGTITIGLLLIMASRMFYNLSEMDQAVVTQLGRPVRLVKEPGLHIKLPFVQQLTFFDNRLLDYDASPALVITRDKKLL